MLRRACTAVAIAIAVAACETFSEATPSDDAGPSDAGATDAAVSDDAAGPDAATVEASDDAGSKLVAFVTSVGYANIASAADADAKCRGEALGRLPGTFVAWFSNRTEVPSTPAASRLVTSKNLGVDGPWYRVDGKRIVASRAALSQAATTPLENPIDLTAAGTPASGSAWTATYADGGVGQLCSAANPTKGLVGATDARWTEQGNFTASCASSLSIYCFQVE